MKMRVQLPGRAATVLPLACAALALSMSMLVPPWVVATAGAGTPVSWAPESSATITPGVMTFTEGSQCTANFVFSDGVHVYIGQAAHCSGTGGNTATDGCTSPSLPLGTPVQVTGASKPGVLVYDSWLTMQAGGEKNPDLCQYNDLALVQLDPADIGSVNPSIPHWGGPDGIDWTGTTAGESVYTYGNSELRAGISALSPKNGSSEGDTGDGWSHTVVTFNPGIPGDSGSAFLDANGNALGVLSTLDAGIPNGVSNGVGDLAREYNYMHAHGFAGVQIVLGTVAFQPGLP